MQFKVGDKVVHRVHGVGEITDIHERTLSDQSVLYYMLQVRDLTIWVPVTDAENHSLRNPTPKLEFEKMIEILDAPGDDLSLDRLERKIHLTEQLKSGSIEGTFKVVRDLAKYRHIKKLNDQDAVIFARAEKLLVEEWGLAMSVSHSEAENALRRRLEKPN